MAVYERETLLDADLDAVWAFHSTIDGLAALTPDWFHLECHDVDVPDGVEIPEDATAGSLAAVADRRELLEGVTVELSVRPFGVGPRRRWRSLIETRRREAGAAVLRDSMVEGPFDRWVHTHSFHDTGRGTRVRDHVAYELGDVPVGVGELPTGGVVDRLLVAGLAPTFRYRHRRLHRLLEDGEWGGWD